MSLCVDQNHRVRRDFRVVRFYDVLDGGVEVFWSRLFDEYRLGQRLRIPRRKLERREKCFWRRRLEFEVERVMRKRWR